MKALICLAAAFLLTGTAAAQFELPGPHESITRFDGALGHWEGSGSFGMHGAEQRMPWTCTLELEKVLDGHAVREVLDVDMGPIGHYHMITLYAYDANRSSLIQTTADNYGGVAQVPCQWIGKSLVTAKADLFPQPDGSLEIGSERSVWTFDGETSTLDITMCAGTHAAYSHVEGTMKRTSPKAKPIDAGMRSEELADTMKPFAPLIGTWHFNGSMVMAPGMPKMDIAGDDDIWAMSGGQALVTQVLGEASEDMGGFQYKAIGFIGWNARKNCWEDFIVSNMGDVMASEWRSAGEGKIVTTHSGAYMGQPYAERGVFEFDAKGPKGMWADRYVGTAEGLRMFEGTYARESAMATDEQ